MTPKQEQFCREYQIDHCATQAAIRAGYSQKTAGSQGERLLRNVEIQNFVQRLHQEQNARLDRNGDEVIRRLWMIVEADGRKAFDAAGQLKHPSELPDDLAAALEVIEMGETPKLKLSSRIKALELLGRHYGKFVDRVEQSGNIGQVVIMMPDNGRS